MPQEIALKVNGHIHRVHVEPDTPRLYVLRNDLGQGGKVRLWSGTMRCVQGPVPAAIASAVFDAVGVRLRQIPFKPEKLLDSLAKRRYTVKEEYRVHSPSFRFEFGDRNSTPKINPTL